MIILLSIDNNLIYQNAEAHRIIKLYNKRKGCWMKGWIKCKYKKYTCFMFI